MTLFCKQIIILLQWLLKKNIIRYKKEVTMKKLLLVAIAAAIPTIANAAVSVDQASAPAVLKNNGYSEEMTNMVNMSKARAMGQEYYTKDEAAFKKQNKFVRFWRKLYVYTDPAAEDYSFYHHNIDAAPKYSDL